MARRTQLLLGVVALCVLAGGMWLVVRKIARVRQHAGAEFRRAAVAQIAAWSETVEWSYFGVSSLAAEQAKVAGRPWIADHLIQMTNGEWMVYFAKSTREDWRVDDIFIGKASDKKWYYSTFKFCPGMAAVTSQPAGIADFVRTYRLKEFDGTTNAPMPDTRD